MIAVVGNESSDVAVVFLLQGSGRRHGWKHSMESELADKLVRLSALLIDLLTLLAAPR